MSGMSGKKLAVLKRPDPDSEFEKLLRRSAEHQHQQKARRLRVVPKPSS
jgi:hypothetical protein